MRVGETRITASANSVASLAAKPVSDAQITYHNLRLGIMIQDTPDRSGARITKVFEGSPAEWYGLRPGEVLSQLTHMGFGDTTKVVKTWQVSDVATTLSVIRNILDPALLQCKLRNPETGQQRIIYIRTLGKLAL